jgi:primosomal protein N' (replication factor Y)
MVEFGPGVEKFEKEIQELFPKARSIIVSSDTTQTIKKLETLIASILNNEVDIIIGTQLIAKGHHFPKLTIVGVVDCDASLFSADITANEKTYQMLTQVSGRAGREETQGVVYFQSYNPDNLILQSIKNGNNEVLIEFEKQNRALGKFPPFGKLATLSLSSSNEMKAYQVAKKIVASFPVSEKLEVFGPLPAPIFKVSRVYKFQITLRADLDVNLQKLLKTQLERDLEGVQLKVEIK